ncbi:MAG: hypothetical protein JXA21_20270 [Anaerolineae bacterium]|nr:hypothetical protein [Anaerolineae bacterium]
MKLRIIRSLSFRKLVLMAALCLLLNGIALARLQTNSFNKNRASDRQVNGYSLEWNTIDGGGIMYAYGNGYELGGTIGQPDAGILAEIGSSHPYTLSGGFWISGRSSIPPKYRIFLPLVMRHSS